MYSDVVGAFEKLGVTFSQDEVRQVFQESDMLENGRLNFKEFLVCLAIGFVLHVSLCTRLLVSFCNVAVLILLLQHSGSRRLRASG